MARRRKNESIFEMLMDAPWWMGVIGAVLFYVMVAIMLPATLAGSPFGALIAGLCPDLGKWLAVACLFSAAISAIRSLMKRPPSVGRRTMDYMPVRPVAEVTAVPVNRRAAVADIDVACPQCKAVLVAPESMIGQPVTCEGCRHSFLIPKPVIKFPDMTSFYSSKRSGHFSSDLLKELEWKRFEQLVEGYFAQTGWRTRPHRTGADGGVDVHLFRPDQDKAAAVVQCKAWNTYSVGVKPVRELFGVMAADGVPEGFFVTSGDYTSEAQSFASGKPMTLIDGRDLRKRLESLTPEIQSDLFSRVTAGDYTTPTCPQCDRKMVRRQAGKGRTPGNEFWGCPSYPRCRQTFQMKQDT
ncbi:MAG: restriction endonuclease [bacterium]